MNELASLGPNMKMQRNPIELNKLTNVTKAESRTLPEIRWILLY